MRGVAVILASVTVERPALEVTKDAFEDRKGIAILHTFLQCFSSFFFDIP